MAKGNLGLLVIEELAEGNVMVGLKMLDMEFYYHGGVESYNRLLTHIVFFVPLYNERCVIM